MHHISVNLKGLLKELDGPFRFTQGQMGVSKVAQRHLLPDAITYFSMHFEVEPS